jgi:hypothetical protein
VEPWWYTIRYFGGALPDGVATAFLFLVSLCALMVSSVIMTLLTNSRNVPPVLSAMCSYNLVERGNLIRISRSYTLISMIFRLSRHFLGILLNRKEKKK